VDERMRMNRRRRTGADEPTGARVFCVCALWAFRRALWQKELPVPVNERMRSAPCDPAGRSPRGLVSTERKHPQNPLAPVGSVYRMALHMQSIKAKEIKQKI
jgi:hypothetical protein